MADSSNRATRIAAPPPTSHPIRTGLLQGVVPFAWLVGMTVAAVMLATLGRLIIGPTHFFAQQTVAVTIAFSDLLVAIIVYGWLIVRLLRRVAQWQQAGEGQRATAALCALGATALIVLLPVILALVVPQAAAP